MKMRPKTRRNVLKLKKNEREIIWKATEGLRTLTRVKQILTKKCSHNVIKAAKAAGINQEAALKYARFGIGDGLRRESSARN